jgi:hypothetical protein
MSPASKFDPGRFFFDRYRVVALVDAGDVGLGNASVADQEREPCACVDVKIKMYRLWSCKNALSEASKCLVSC